MPSLQETLFGRKDKFRQQSVLTPEQQGALSNFFQNGIQTTPLFGAGSNYLQRLLGGDQSAFDLFEAPLLQRFEQQIAPGIAERFAGMGTGGSLSSSGLQQSLAQAGRGLATDLGGLRGQLQMQALPQALGYAQQPFTNTLGGLGVRGFENFYQPGNLGLFGELIKGAGQGLSSGIGMGAGYGLMNKFGGFGAQPQA